MIPQLSQGVKSILLASFLFGIINTLVKFLSHIPAIEIVFFRSLVSFVLSFIMVRKLKLKIFNQYSSLLFLRGISGAIALSFYFYTIQVIPLATAVTILYLAPVFTIVLAIFMVKEKPNIKQWPFIMMSFIGATVLKGFDLSISYGHFFMGLIAAFFAGLAYNFIRLLRGKAHPQLIILYFPMITLPLSLPFLYIYWRPPSFFDLLAMILIGVLTQLAQIAMTKAYLLEKASKISHYNYLTSGYALIAGYFFFGEMVEWNGFVGIILIISGVMFSSYFSPKD